jgi:K+-sensing histidine kinase KdpD
MPQIDGLNVLKLLKRSPKTCDIPVIFITAKSDYRDLRSAMESGADDYLVKPFSKKELLRSVSARLEKQALIRKANAERLETLRTNIARSFPHEFLTPLSTIIGFSEFLINNYNPENQSDTLELIQLIHNSGQRLQRLSHNFILFAELETKSARCNLLRDNPDFTSIKYVVNLAAYTIAARSKRQEDLKIDIEDVIVKISHKYLTKIIEEIIDNAFEFSKTGDPVRVISTLQNKFCDLYIISQGEEMTNEQISNIGAFMQFDHDKYEQRGIGLGLAIAKRILEIYGGELLIESLIYSQTIVLIKLPI